jgi:transcriptional regulator with XRE-family HTH domain
MNKIVSNVKRIREQKGYSQEYMAVMLGMTQPSYSRIESQEAGLSIEQLQKIADILETDISDFLDNSKISIQNQTNSDVEFVNTCVENLHIENKETTKKLIQALEEEIQHLKNEVEFLRSLVKTSPAEL